MLFQPWPPVFCWSAQVFHSCRETFSALFHCHVNLVSSHDWNCHNTHEGDDKADTLGPHWEDVVVVLARDEVYPAEDENGKESNRSDVPPADVPDFSWSRSEHQFNILEESFHTVDPSKGRAFNKSNQQKGVSRSVVVKQSHDIHAALSAEGESDEKSSDRDADEQKQRFVPEGSGKLVHESGLNSSHSGDLCAETQSDQHGKKHDWPQLRDGQFSDQCWVEDKGQSGAISGNRIHRLVQLIGHVANDGEDDESSEYWSHAVEDGDQDGIKETVVVELVVAG